MEDHAAEMVPELVPGARFIEERNNELTRLNLRADIVYLIEYNGEPAYLEHGAADGCRKKYGLSHACLYIGHGWRENSALVFALAGRKLISSALQATLATGFLGGYTTFSTMSWEGFQFVRGGSTPRSLLYLGGSALLGLLAAMLGLLLGGWLP